MRLQKSNLRRFASYDEMTATTPDGRLGVLTTDHTAPSYGRHVLVIDGEAFGPADVGPLKADTDAARLAAHRAGYAVKDTSCVACGGTIWTCACENFSADDLREDVE